MKSRDLIKLGIPRGVTLVAAQHALAGAARAGLGKSEVRRALAALVEAPEAFAEHPVFGGLARALAEERGREARGENAPFRERNSPASWRRWGGDLEPEAVAQMENACRLPVAVRGALMPDAHLGYGLPIGGVLAVREAVIPYAVGVDIACRMKLSVLDLPPATLMNAPDRLQAALEGETRFGVGALFKEPLEHRVMDEDWSVSPVTRRLKDKAWSQLGTSGSGNHFVEFGELVLEQPELGLAPGVYLALLSHSGSRGTGLEVAGFYSRLARALRPNLPRELAHLAWLDLASEAGREYWNAMQLMGRYAAANHELIHERIARALRAETLLGVENHHNFAWREVHDGEEVIVHRKGATPAGAGLIGIIPGSMATPAFIVRGLGEPASLNSASHGAGRRMSRRQARERYSWADARRVLEQAGVTLISAGLDELPMAYKDIESVMASQRDLVEPLARFHPRLVKMAPQGERPED